MSILYTALAVNAVKVSLLRRGAQVLVVISLQGLEKHHLQASSSSGGAGGELPACGDDNEYRKGLRGSLIRKGRCSRCGYAPSKVLKNQ